jgi:hypothetical protein
MSMAERLKRSGHKLKKRNSANYYLGIRLPDSDSGQIGFPDEEEKSGDGGDVCNEIPIRAHAHAQSERLGNVSTVCIESVPATTDQEDENEPRFALMPDDELDQIARLTTQQIIDQEHREQKKNGKPAEHPGAVLPAVPAEAFAEHAKAPPFVEDEASFTAERWQSDDEGQVSG